tara:strand:+ start:44 stop:289 length:246 start_codon:yes stop_codon:yes gene_type:complete
VRNKTLAKRVDTGGLNRLSATLAGTNNNGMLSAAATVRTPRQAAVSGRNQSIHFTTVTLAQMQIDWHKFAISPQKRTMRRT